MNEFTGGVLLAQIRKMDKIISGVRSAAKRVYDGIADISGIELRKRPDPEGELGAGVFFGFKGKDERDRFIAALKAEGIPAGGPGGSVILPLLPHIQKKVTVHPDWPSFTTPRGKAMRYGPDTCPKTVAILNRFGGPLMDPKYTKADTDYIVAAIRKLFAG
jgi:8-amino-3,8-dideoxy-alpha-D-manno-octulosonate transaminase